MRVTMHQPEHLPWLGFFHKMAQADLYVYLDVVQYRRQYFQNRNRIVGVREPIWLLVPVRKLEHRHGPIMRVPLDNSRAWRKTYWGSIAYHYHNHPHFERYADELRSIVLTPFEQLTDLNYALIDFCRRAFAITTPLVRASSLDVDGKRSSLIHDVMVRTGATTYLSGPTGREYLDEEPFRASGIAVEYHDFHHPRYAQRGRAAFSSHLAALDLIMNEGPRCREVLLGKPLVTSVVWAPDRVESFTKALKSH
ncbi:MAG: WbqC-like protein family protein [Cyanobacteria bacterium RYN_339]|nr:WbqC-like protein family protein [Cyanobacteria bacterium RYN_339]